MRLEEGQHVVIQDLNGGHRHLRGVEPGPDEAAEGVQHGLDVDLAHTRQRAGREGIDGYKFASGIDLDVPVGVLGVEALQRLVLLVRQLDLPLPDRLLQPQQPVVARLEVVADPDPPHTAGTDLGPPQHPLVCDSLGPVCGVVQRIGHDRLFDRCRYAVGVRPLGTRHPVKQAVGAVQLKAPPDLLELLAGVADDPVCLRDVAECLGEL